MFTSRLQETIENIAHLFPRDSYLGQTFIIKSLLAVILVSLICGAIGSMVVGNRMAFFSDALAHCAFTGIALGLLLGLATDAENDPTFDQLHLPLIMAGFGMSVGVGIAYVHEKTGLANDTVIGVFFAGAIGFGALVLKALGTRKFYDPEVFLFGDPLTVGPLGLLLLLGLAILTTVVLFLLYNQLVFTSFNPSLARSRRVPLRLCNYLFIILLALIVNLCLKTVGVLLINALLIVPAATAANLCRNMRQLFWTTIALCVFVGVVGNVAAWELNVGLNFPIGVGGAIVVLSVLLFFVSMALGPWLRGKQAY